MKILITDIHHGNGGGHVTYVLSLLEGLKNEVDLTIAVPPTGRLYQLASSMPGVRVLPGLYTSRPLTLLAEVRQLRRFLKQERFDVVHVNGGADHRHIMFACMGLKHRPAIVWTKHNTNPVSSFGHGLRAKYGTNITIAVSNYVAQMLSNSGYKGRPIHVVRNGIDINHLQPVSQARKQELRQGFFGPLQDDVLVLGSIGGTDYNKGWLVLVEAIASLEPAIRRRFRVLVAGDPPAQAMLDKVAASGLQEQLRFPGLVKDVRKVLGACDVGFVLSYREAASYAACETMAMGMPALVSDAGGLPENVRDGKDGWVVPAGNVEVLAQVLRQIAANEACLQTMGKSARNRVEHAFSTVNFISGTKSIYQQARVLARQGAG